MRKPSRTTALQALIIVGSVALSSVANAACYPASAKLPDTAIQAFLKNPNGLLSAYEDGGGLLVSVVRDLVASDNSALSLVVGLLASANPRQREAIGSGLGLAAQICLVPEQAYAGQIQASLVETADTIALTAFVASVGQTTGTSAIPDTVALTAFVAASGQKTGTSRFTGAPLLSPIASGSRRTLSSFTFSGSSITYSGGSSTRSTVSKPVSP
jgi:hypothetical protein